jgi:ribosomal protein S18 acetylase RimI-like enzyme
MNIRSLMEKDRARLLSMLIKTRAFTSAEIDVAMELIDIVLKDGSQEDYEIDCMADDQDQVIGYICYGSAPMTQGTFDLYWIAVDPDSQEKGVGSRLLSFLEKRVKAERGRMILADTSTVPQYEKTRKFYLKNGFEEVAVIRDYYYPGNDRVTFCRRLTPLPPPI